MDFQHDSSVSVRKEKNTLIFHGFRAYILVFLKNQDFGFQENKDYKQEKLRKKKVKGKFSSID